MMMLSYTLKKQVDLFCFLCDKRIDLHPAKIPADFSLVGGDFLQKIGVAYADCLFIR
nr:MAG TPA: hypothetical protein [Caudoviricetes sp.]